MKPEYANSFGVRKVSGKDGEVLEVTLDIAYKYMETAVTVTAKGGGNGRLFGSITNQEIADALEKQASIKLDKRKIVISDPIKNAGTYTVTCKLGYETTAPWTVKIVEG